MIRPVEVQECDQRIERAGNLIDEKKYQEAVSSLKKIESENKDLIKKSAYLRMGLHSYLGLAFYHLDGVEGSETDAFLLSAVEHFSKALAIKGTAENVLFMRAKCHDYLNNFELAKEDYEKVLSLNPSAESAHSFLGLLMENEGYIEKAIELYKTALALDADDQLSTERLAKLNEKGSESM